jgi:hypothetical protein
VSRAAIRVPRRRRTRAGLVHCPGVADGLSDVGGSCCGGALRAQVPPTWYAPLSQFDVPEFTQRSFEFQLAVRSRTNSPVASNDVAAAIGRVNPRLALTFRPLSDYVETARNQERLVALLAGAFGTLGLVLAALGLYGITAYAVTVRRSEIDPVCSPGRRRSARAAYQRFGAERLGLRPSLLDASGSRLADEWRASSRESVLRRKALSRA